MSFDKGSRAGYCVSQDRLLIIDDKRLVGDVIGKIGQSAGFQVEITDRVEDFWKQLEAFQPSVVSVDLMMPDTDGIELMRELAAHGCRAKIIIASGLDVRALNAARDLAREYGLQVAGVISKPIHVADFRAILNELKRP